MYSGVTIRYPLGDGGFNGSRNFRRIPVGELVQAQNIRMQDEVVSKAGGLRRFESSGELSGTPGLMGGFDWHPTSSDQYQVTAWDDGKIYRSGSGDIDATTLSSAGPTSNPAIFVECGQENAGNNKELLLFAENIAPLALSGTGTSMSALSAIPSEWSSTPPFAGLYHDFRVFAWYENTVYTSYLDDHTKFFDATESVPAPIFQVQAGLGRRIAAAIPDITQGSRRLYFFKYPVGIVSIDTSNIISLFVPQDIVSRDVGCAGPRAVAQVENDILFVGANGHLYSLSAVLTNKNVNQADLTVQFEMEDWIRQNVSIKESDLKHTNLVYDSQRKELWVSYRSSTASYNDVGYVVDFSGQQKPRVFIEKGRGEVFNAIWPFVNSSTSQLDIYVGGAGGMFYQANYSNFVVTASDDSTTPYSAIVELPETDFSWASEQLAEKFMRFDWMELETIAKSETDISIQFIIDGNAYRTQTVSLNAEGTPLGQFQLGVSRLGGGIKVKRKRFQIGGWGRKLGVKLSHTTSGGFEIIGLRFGVKPLRHEGQVT